MQELKLARTHSRGITYLSVKTPQWLHSEPKLAVMEEL